MKGTEREREKREWRDGEEAEETVRFERGLFPARNEAKTRQGLDRRMHKWLQRVSFASPRSGQDCFRMRDYEITKPRRE